ncbi:MAG: proline dehydrogenase [Calditrichaeota bacterium]|nr:MAG: proline dehydrogenase [Calditrichota bacterium]
MRFLDKMVVWSLPLVPKPLVGFFSRDYIAGSEMKDALDIVKELNGKGIMVTLDLLGEEVTHKEQSTAAADEYIRMLEEINRLKLDSNISLKPTHMGLLLDNAFCYDTIERIVKKAAELNNFVRIDMEDHTTTSNTIDFYLRLKEKYNGHVGTVIQAYLRRTNEDIEHLMRHQANLRLCKGIYVEPREVAFKDMAIINESYKYNLERLLRCEGCYVGIATHDEKLVWHAQRLIHDLKIPREKYEFQMLLGVDPQLRDIIVKAGHRLRVYVPYGREWYAYSIRRLKENPRMAGMVFKKVFGLD